MSPAHDNVRDLTASRNSGFALDHAWTSTKSCSARRGRNCRAIDIVPTIASVLGARSETRLDGVPLAAQPRTTNATTPVQVRHGRTKKLVSVPFGEFVRARDAEVARQRGSFPDGLQSLFAIGPNQQLIGRRVSSPAAGTGPAQIHINDAAAFGFVDHRWGSSRSTSPETSPTTSAPGCRSPSR